jgi:hypothetical protein
MPLTAVILISAWEFRRKREMFTEVLTFALLSAIVAFLWYVRNWLWMGNPIYPFLFGGRYWDPFRSEWFATPGTGSGWDLKALILLPLTITLGYQDINSIDADIGPLLLLALPLALWVMLRIKNAETSRKITLTAIGFFTFFSAAFWVYGYITTRDLWQTRLLLPAIVPFVIPASVGIASLGSLDTKRLRLSFIVATIAAVAVYVNLVDMGLSVVARNPLSIAAGITTSQNYVERYQPGYAQALQIVSQTPVHAKIYSLFEPRSYGMVRTIQPDPILDNFSHDVYLYGDPQTIANKWRQQGYTHVLLNKRLSLSILGGQPEMEVLNEVIELLESVSVAPGGDYELLEIPARGP